MTYENSSSAHDPRTHEAFGWIAELNQDFDRAVDKEITDEVYAAYARQRRAVGLYEVLSMTHPGAPGTAAMIMERGIPLTRKYNHPDGTEAVRVSLLSPRTGQDYDPADKYLETVIGDVVQGNRYYPACAFNAEQMRVIKEQARDIEKYRRAGLRFWDDASR